MRRMVILYHFQLNLGIKSTELDNLIAETAAYLNILHPDYGKLAARVAVTKLHKETSEKFIDAINKLYHYTDEATGNFGYSYSASSWSVFTNLIFLLNRRKCFPHLEGSIRDHRYESPKTWGSSSLQERLGVWLFRLQDPRTFLLAQSSWSDCRETAAHANASVSWHSPERYRLRDKDLSSDEWQMVHSCDSHSLQLWDPEASDEFLLPAYHEGRLNSRYIRHPKEHCTDFEVSWWHRACSSLHQSDRLLH